MSYNMFRFGTVMEKAGVDPDQVPIQQWEKVRTFLEDEMPDVMNLAWPTRVREFLYDTRSMPLSQKEADWAQAKLDEPIAKVYGQEQKLNEGEEPFPDTGLEHMILYALIARELCPTVKTTDKEIAERCLTEKPDRDVYNEPWETRFYLPKEIEELPKDERLEATLKLLREVKSSSVFRKALNLWHKQS